MTDKTISPCQADVLQIIHPFKVGSSGVEIIKCKKYECPFKDYDEWILKHIESARKILENIGIDADRFKITCEEKRD